MPRLLIAAAVLSVLLGTWLAGVIAGASQGGRTPAAASHAASLESLGPASALPISQAVGRADPAYHATASAAGASFSTPAQAMSENFSSAGVTVHAGALALGLDLTGVGTSTALAPVAQTAPTATGNRVLYSRGAVSEWYVNGPAGLEQGFTVASAPAGSGPLTLGLTISGNASAHAGTTPQSIDFKGPAGKLLRYGDLRAVDAAGHPLSARLAIHGRTLQIEVNTSGARFPVRIDPLVQQGGRLSEGNEGLFGFSVSLSADGNTALVGAPRTPLNRFAGTAWVFTMTYTGWAEQAEFGTSEPGGSLSPECAAAPEHCSIGTSVSLSADGNTALVGAPSPRKNGYHGQVFVYTREGTVWTRTATLLAGSEQAGGGGFGQGVAVSADGTEAIVGAPQDLSNRGSVWIFQRSGSTWSHDGGLLNGGKAEVGPGHLGYSVAIDGNTAIAGAPDDGSAQSGAVWDFTRTSSGWTLPGNKIVAPGAGSGAHFGYSVALAGERAIVGAPGAAAGAGVAWGFTQATAALDEPFEITGSGEVGAGAFGSSVALSGDGHTALIGAPGDSSGAGAAWLFGSSGGAWTTLQQLGSGEAEQLKFGTSVALSGDGTSALVGGAPEESRMGAVWSFGHAVAPVVGAVHPESGPVAGGTTVVIEGSGFKAGATVTIGTAATSVKVISTSKILATTQANPAGSDEVIVSDSGGTSTGGPLFTFTPPKPPAPTVTSVEPSSGPAAGGSEVTITGTGFVSGAAVVIGSPAESVNVISSTEIRAVTAATPAGSDEVVVSDANGTSENGPSFTYTSPPPAQEKTTTTSTTTTTTTTTTTPTPHIAASGVLGSSEQELPAPVLATSGNIKRVTGTIYIKLPGSSGFTVLSPQAHVPFGTVIDATSGHVQVITAGPSGPETITYYGGVFKLTQSRKGSVIATLTGGSRVGCPVAKRNTRHLDSDGDFDNDSYARAARSTKRVVRKLWSEGHGHYTTKGSYATGAVLGTRWLTEDLCDGTLIHVSTDMVLVTNLRTHRKVIVRAGHSIFVKAP